jgi:hypothetical protein
MRATDVRSKTDRSRIEIEIEPLAMRCIAVMPETPARRGRRTSSAQDHERHRYLADGSAVDRIHLSSLGGLPAQAAPGVGAEWLLARETDHSSSPF